jgi:hypothetical protein
MGSRRTHCRRGHEFTRENTYSAKEGKRTCKTCMMKYGAKYNANGRKPLQRDIKEEIKYKIQVDPNTQCWNWTAYKDPCGYIGRPNREKTHCANGHEYTQANTWINKKGGRICKTCKKLQHSRWSLRKRGLK